MSRNTKKHNDKCTRRSALSFDICANGSLDDEHILASEPWKNIKIFETSEAAAIQNVLDEFNNMIIQEKALKVKDHTTTKKVSPRSTKKSPIKISAMDLPGTSSSTNNNANSGETKTINKNKRTSTKPRRTSIDNVKEDTQNISKAKENVMDDSTEKTITTEILQNIMNITYTSPRTSTPKKEGSTAENKKPKTKNSENKSEKSAQSKKKPEKLKKDTKDKQGENSANMLGKNKKTNVKSENNLESKVNKKSSKNKVEDKKAECCATLPSEKMEKTRDVVEISKKREKNAKSKEERNKSQLKRKNLKKENPEDKLQKGAQPHKSLKPSGINDVENTKCQCKESCAKYSDNQCSSEAKKHVKKRRDYKKNIKAARDIEDLSRHITAVKRKMECIKNDLESNESFDSSYSEESSYSTHSSDSSCSCTSSYICEDCDTSDYTKSTLNSSDSSNSRES